MGRATPCRRVDRSACRAARRDAARTTDPACSGSEWMVGCAGHGGVARSGGRVSSLGRRTGRSGDTRLGASADHRGLGHAGRAATFGGRSRLGGARSRESTWGHRVGGA